MLYESTDIILVYYLYAEFIGIWAMIFLMINQVGTLIFLRYLCCPAFATGLQVMFSCKCEHCKKYIKYPLWLNTERHDEIITEQEYDEYILKMSQDSSALQVGVHGKKNKESGETKC